MPSFVPLKITSVKLAAPSEEWRKVIVEVPFKSNVVFGAIENQIGVWSMLMTHFRATLGAVTMGQMYSIH